MDVPVEVDMLLDKLPVEVDEVDMLPVEVDMLPVEVDKLPEVDKLRGVVVDEKSKPGGYWGNLHMLLYSYT